MQTQIRKTLLPLLAIAFLSQACSKSSGGGGTGGGTGGGGSATPQYTKKVLVEDFTGTWCGYCPAMSDALDNKSRSTPNLVFSGMHDAAGRTDPYHSIYSVSLRNAFGVSAFPTALVNRVSLADQGNVTSFIDANLGTKTHTGLKIESTFGAGNTTLNVICTAGFSDNINEQLKMVCYLVEDSLRFNQVNFYSGPNPLPNYLHRNVVREAGNGAILGEAIGTATNAKGSTLTKAYTFNTAGYNIANLKVITAIVNNAGKQIFNVQIAKAGTTQSFD